MIDKDKIPKSLLPIVEDRLKDLANEIAFPPPVFDTMQVKLSDLI